MAQTHPNALTHLRKAIDVGRDALASNYLPLAGFMLRQRFVGFEVPSFPHFDSESATQWFRTKLERSRRYLEYGSGGSTYLAAKYGVPFISIDSDSHFLWSVRKKIIQDRLFDKSNQTFRHADIGFTRPWGYPLMQRKASAERLEAFRKYSDPPKECMSRRFMPDLVLIDGRFRVACALKILKILSDQEGWTIAFDDYRDRPGYHILAEFAELERYVGQMAIFTRARPVDPKTLDAAIRRYETVAA